MTDPAPTESANELMRGPSTLADRHAESKMALVWFLRAIEQTDGSWACRWGNQLFDEHPELDEALEHLREIASDKGPAEFFVHFLDGRVTQHPEA